MSDSTSTPKSGRATGTGSRIAGAKKKGAAHAAAGNPKENPYVRPNMAKAWADGFDSHESTAA